MNILRCLAVSLSLACLTCSLPIAVIAATADITSTKVSTEAKQKVSLLFVLRAETGVIAKTDDGYTLTLQGVDDKVLYFSDRPVRKAGFITMTQLMNDWAKGKNSFQANPPNAAIVHASLKSNEKGVAQAIPVELTNPVATANGWLFHVADLHGKISIGSYHEVSVFIDDSLGFVCYGRGECGPT
ncbi:MAG: hypothetical protein A3E83_03120 [Gammaproteobacteria bacterium RIFCSPHIGHO2_12_FULL_41_20]|nr:MAG: hypothetical protein A3E83_03120 [Gammaproteobacteria bacterium RIFCSPHIGHO2_12_FULL_41_20]